MSAPDGWKLSEDGKALERGFRFKDFSEAFGFLTRFAALALAADMAVAIVMVHLKNGFFSEKGGYELVLALGCMAFALLIGGGGNLSVDRMISSKGSRSSA